MFIALDVTVFSRKDCPYCTRTEGLLHDAGINFENLVLNRDFSESTLRAVSGMSTMPQVFVNGDHSGGAEALESWLDRQARHAT